MALSDGIKKRETLLSLTNKLDNLPMLPVVVTELMALSPDDEEFFEKVLALAKNDPPFSIRLLKYANSAIQFPASTITTLQSAITRIGTNKVHNLIFSMSVLRVFIPATQGQRNLWAHAIQVAITSQTIAELEPSLGVDPEHAYVCGLMHDIGRFIMFDESTEELGKIDETNWTTPEQLIDVEMELCGFNHAELGWHACKKWKLPKIIELCVKEHHNYGLHTNNPKFKKLENLIHIVQMADFFSVLILVEPEVLSLPPKKLEQTIAKHCISTQWKEAPCSAKQLQNIALQIYNQSEEILAHLGISSS
ncbi:MAG: HDOD domain-containing protein [Methyloprofundus sp.]|nr:HDOD domain-containing protein [Methyloprofundus sp.]